MMSKSKDGDGDGRIKATINVSAYLAGIGRRGGQVKSEAKRRGPEHYRAISGRATRWERKTEWTAVKIRSGKAGWVVEMWSAIQGEMTGRRVLVPYSDDLPRGADLSGAWNDYTDRGGYLLMRAHEDPACRVLAKGRKVQ